MVFVALKQYTDPSFSTLTLLVRHGVLIKQKMTKPLGFPVVL